MLPGYRHPRAVTSVACSRANPARPTPGLNSCTHSWAGCPADPTRGVVIDFGTDYLKFGIGRDYSEVPPVSGSFISRGDGHLDFTTAAVFFDRDTIAIDDALELLQSDPATPQPRPCPDNLEEST